MQYGKNMSDPYRLTVQDRLLYGTAGGSIAALILMIFYRSPRVAAIGGAAAFLLFPLIKKKDIFARRRRKITLEFKESLFTLSASLRAGESLEKAFESTVNEMDAVQYPYLYDSWRKILARMQLGQSLEELLLEYAANTRVDELLSFASIIAVSKRTQGNITGVIDNTAGLLQEKIEMSEELTVMLARKKTEQRIMNVMPLLVIAMLTSMSPEYVQPLYGTLQGRIVMTGCILLAGASLWIARRISDIRL